MATKVYMPALGMAQETGKLISWLKEEGDPVVRGEPIAEIETDKAVVEYDAPADGFLRGVKAQPGQDVPVGEVIAWILAPGEELPDSPAPLPYASEEEGPAAPDGNAGLPQVSPPALEISPLARNIAREHNVDLSRLEPKGSRIQKADVLAFIQEAGARPARKPASPKARRLADEHTIDIETVTGSGPEGAVLAADILKQAADVEQGAKDLEGSGIVTSRAWSVMAGRLAEAWRTIPHFYLERELNASGMVAWRMSAQKETEHKITYTDLLTRAAAAALRKHPRVNASWINGEIRANPGIHIGLAVATEDGLVVPVIPHTDTLSVSEIAERRQGLVSRAMEGRLKLQDLQGGTFTISNLGMYGVGGFSAIVNPPQAAILAVGKIVEKALPVDGQILIVPTLKLTLSCDHRVVDGARGALFLDLLATLLEDPMRIL